MPARMAEMERLKVWEMFIYGSVVRDDLLSFRYRTTAAMEM